MRVAAVYDIHGNLPALEAVLNDIRQAGVDRVVVGDDVVPGPMPRETLACLLGLDVPVEFIRGCRSGARGPRPRRCEVGFNSHLVKLPAGRSWRNYSGGSRAVDGRTHILLVESTRPGRKACYFARTPVGTESGTESN
jgi:hypothetical protein